jgi:hypothetical protein
MSTKASPELYIALYDFAARTPSQLSFKKGDILQIERKDASGWWSAKLSDKQGFAPEKYIRRGENASVLFDLHSNSPQKLDVRAGDVVLIYNS